MLRRLYDWCIDAAGKPYATWIMGAVSFVESSFFPVPPDAMLIPMSLARPDRAWRYAAVCTVASVAGGMLGYFIGAALYDSLGLWLMRLYGYGDKVEAFRQAYAQYGAWIIVGKGLTPIPYKLVTIVSGFAGYNFPAFVFFSIIARLGMRFFCRGVRPQALRPAGAGHHREAAGALGRAEPAGAGGRNRRSALYLLIVASSFLPRVIRSLIRLTGGGTAAAGASGC